MAVGIGRAGMPHRPRGNGRTGGDPEDKHPAQAARGMRSARPGEPGRNAPSNERDNRRRRGDAVMPPVRRNRADQDGGRDLGKDKADLAAR